MFIYDILRSFVIEFKNKYTGSTDIFVEGIAIPSDKDFINISLYSKTSPLYDKIANHQAEPCVLLVSLNLYKSNTPYPTQIKEIEKVLQNIRDFNLYNFEVKPAVITNISVDIDERSPPLPLKYGDFLSISWLIFAVNVN